MNVRNLTIARRAICGETYASICGDYGIGKARVSEIVMGVFFYIYNSMRTHIRYDDFNEYYGSDIISVRKKCAEWIALIDKQIEIESQAEIQRDEKKAKKAEEKERFEIRWAAYVAEKAEKEKEALEAMRVKQSVHGITFSIAIGRPKTEDVAGFEALNWVKVG